jgi:hypothetical protein
MVTSLGQSRVRRGEGENITSALRKVLSRESAQKWYRLVLSSTVPEAWALLSVFLKCCLWREQLD